MFFGGAAGGGKTDLLLGCARQHWRAILFRRIFKSLTAIIDRSRQIYNPEGSDAFKDSYNEGLYRWKFGDGTLLRFAAMQLEEDKRNFQGQPHDFYGFDEITEFTESQFRFVTGWNRTVKKNTRCRVVCTGNPPTNADGEWIIQYFAPWLDPSHIDPAISGELRWYTTIGGKDVACESGEPILHKGEKLIPRSRTFIPSRLADNPYLMDRGYGAVLQALPEPLRTQMLYGDFTVGRDDDPWQVIPTAWVDAAQERWRNRKHPETPLSGLGVDVARGGKDKTVLTRRYDNYFAMQDCFAGQATPDGPAVVQLIIRVLNGAKCPVKIDVIGVGTSVYDHAKSILNAIPMNGSEASIARDKSEQLAFINKRAEWYWKLREALDPSSGEDLALPDDRELKVDLCAARWELMARGIKIESKDNIIERLGRSPDKGDSLVYAFGMSYGVGDNVIAALTKLNTINTEKRPNLSQFTAHHRRF